MSPPSKATKPRRSPCSATVVAEMRDVQVPYGAPIVTKLTYRFFEDALRDPLRFGTFAPERRASERPMAIACLRLGTRPPEGPRFHVPRLGARVPGAALS